MKSICQQLRHSLRPLRARYERFLGRHFPKKLSSILYKRHYGVDIDWKHPKTIDEKINWLKYNTDTSQWTLLADKYRVRKYVEDCGLKDILVPLYGRWDRAEDIDWDALPNQFVIKTNNASKSVLICKDKTSLDVAYWTKEIDKWMHSDYSSEKGEIHYRAITPCIIAEQLLDAAKQAVPSSSLIDYKVWAFDGKPTHIWCCLNRTADSVEVITYDTGWNAHPEYSENYYHFIPTDKRLPRPATLDQMLDAAARLSKGFPQVRVDFYEVDGKLYFGEMTFTSSAGINGFYTREFLLELGRMTKLPTDE